MASLSKQRKSLRFATLMLAIAAFAVWLVLLIIKYLTTGVSLGSLFSDITANILGIIPPIIIFNFVYEYVSKQYVADDISEQLMETLTGNPAMIGTFRPEVRLNFIKAGIRSLVGDEKADMVDGVLEPYVGENAHNMRTHFMYDIDIDACMSQDDIGTSLLHRDDYFIVRESLSYTRVLAQGEDDLTKVNIGFFVESDHLSEELLGKTFLFRESLKILPKDLQKLINLNDDEKLAFVNSCFQMQLLVKSVEYHMVSCSITAIGIEMTMESPEPMRLHEYPVLLGFRMPQQRRRSDFLVSVTEPTFAPEIIFRYKPHVTSVSTYTFMNEDAQLLHLAGAIKGRVTINPAGWVYPVKGVVFIVEDVAAPAKSG